MCTPGSSFPPALQPSWGLSPRPTSSSPKPLGMGTLNNVKGYRWQPCGPKPVPGQWIDSALRSFRVLSSEQEEWLWGQADSGGTRAGHEPPPDGAGADGGQSRPGALSSDHLPARPFTPAPCPAGLSSGPLALPLHRSQASEQEDAFPCRLMNGGAGPGTGGPQQLGRVPGWRPPARDAALSSEPHCSGQERKRVQQMAGVTKAACCGQTNYLSNYDLPLNHMIFLQSCGQLKPG